MQVSRLPCGIHWLLAVIVPLGLLASGPVRAQSPSGNNSRAAPTLEEVIVTATRRDAPAATVPVSVSVLTGDDLERLGASGFSDYARSVPGLSYTDGGTGGEKHTIRGISTNAWIDFNAATALYFGEVPMTHASGGIGPPFTAHPLLVDIQRI